MSGFGDLLDKGLGRLVARFRDTCVVDRVMGLFLDIAPPLARNEVFVGEAVTSATTEGLYKSERVTGSLQLGQEALVPIHLVIQRWWELCLHGVSTRSWFTASLQMVQIISSSVFARCRSSVLRRTAIVYKRVSIQSMTKKIKKYKVASNA